MRNPCPAYPDNKYLACLIKSSKHPTRKASGYTNSKSVCFKS